MKQLKGIITAMVTPFDINEKLDIDASVKMAKWLVDKGVHGLFLVGTNGEFHLMDDQEKVDLVYAISKAVGHKTIICAGAGCCSTQQTIALGKKLSNAGADYISIVTPYYLIPNQEDLYIHYKTIAEELDKPVILYNIPGQTGLQIEVETLKRLSLIDNIVAIKDSSGNFDLQKQYITATKDSDFMVLNGSDSLMLDAFVEGAVASVAATSNVIPEIEVKLYDYFCNNDMKNAKIMRQQMDVLRMGLKNHTAPAMMKAILNAMNVRAGITRGPIQMPNYQFEGTIREVLDYYSKVNQ